MGIIPKLSFPNHHVNFKKTNSGLKHKYINGKNYLETVDLVTPCQKMF